MAYSNYWVARKRYSGWRSYKDSGLQAASPHIRSALSDGQINGWYPEEAFDSVDDARACIEELRRAVNRSHVEFGVLDDDGNLVWSEQGGFADHRDTKLSCGCEGPICQFTITLSVESEKDNPQEEHMSQGDIDQPLHIPRQALIDALQANLDAEAAKREAAAAKKAENRSRVTAAVKSLSDDELVNFFTRTLGITQALQLEQWVESVKEAKQYVSIENEVSEKESTLEKTVRVLTMASDDNIEIKPNDPIYPLL